MLALNFNGGALLDAFFYFCSAKWAWIWIYVWVVLWVGVKRSWKEAVMLLLAIGLVILLADQTSNIFKTYVPKFRPTHNEQIKEMIHTVFDYRGGLYGTVSAHAATNMAWAVLSAMVIKKRWYAVLIGFWVLLVSYSRIYLGVHFPMDIVFGWITGVVWGICVWKLFTFARRKWIK